MIVEIGLPIALALIMLSLGVGLTPGDFARVARMPKPIAVGLAMQMMFLPLLALALLQIFPLPPALAFGVMLLSFCPGGVTSNVLTKFAGGTVALSITLTAVVSLVSVLTVPVLVAWAGAAILGDSANIDVTGIALTMFAITAVPVGLGVAIRALAPAATMRMEPVLSFIAIALFVVLILAALAVNWTTFITSIGTLGPLLVSFNILAFAAAVAVARGLSLTGKDARSIAIELGVQNGTLGITVAGLVAGQEGLLEFALPSAVYGIVMYLITLPAILLIRRMG